MKTILYLIVLFAATCLAQESVPEFSDTVLLKSEQVRAILISAQALSVKHGFNPEQRNIANYTVTIHVVDDGLAVSFIAIPRHGDEGTFGGNFSYARSTNFVVDRTTFKILREFGSK